MHASLELIKDYLPAFGVGCTLFTFAWFLHGIRETLDKITGNHLSHLQASGEKISEELSALRESGGRNEAQHDQQIDLLHDIREELRK